MAGGDGDDPPPLVPARVVPTQAWRAEQQRKQAAYAAGRARYVAAWHRRRAGLPEEQEPEPAEEVQGAPAAGEGEGQGEAERGRRSRARGRVHDSRQGSLKLDE